MLRALVIGADFVMVGRPLLWGLAIASKKGVDDVIRILNEELVDMKQCGVASIQELRTKNIIYKPEELLFVAKL